MGRTDVETIWATNATGGHIRGCCRRPGNLHLKKHTVSCPTAGLPTAAAVIVDENVIVFGNPKVEVFLWSPDD